MTFAKTMISKFKFKPVFRLKKAVMCYPGIKLMVKKLVNRARHGIIFRSVLIPQAGTE